MCLPHSDKLPRTMKVDSKMLSLQSADHVSDTTSYLVMYKLYTQTNKVVINEGVVVKHFSITRTIPCKSSSAKSAIVHAV